MFAMALLAVVVAPIVAALADRHVASPRHRYRGVSRSKWSGIATTCGAVVTLSVLCAGKGGGASANSALGCHS